MARAICFALMRGDLSGAICFALMRGDLSGAIRFALMRGDLSGDIRFALMRGDWVRKMSAGAGPSSALGLRARPEFVNRDI
ncbi:MAG: hypothetical protein K5989_01390 [Lachnospiraceae bacterium]|nr:hypothetical protein [Lachnospiraceae bacterium]